MVNNENFSDYFRLVDNHVNEVLGEMALGNIDSEKSLRECVENTVQIFCPIDAFEVFNNQSPYEWQDVLNYPIIVR